MNAKLHNLPMPSRLQAVICLIALAQAALALATDWPCYRADAARSATTSEEPTFPLALRWVYTPAQRPRPAGPVATWS